MDRINGRLMGGLAAALAVLASGIGYVGYRVQRATPGSSAWVRAEKAAHGKIASWPEPTKMLGGVLLERYGPPESMDSETMVWTGRYPWHRIVLHKDPEDAPVEHVMAYDVPPERVDDVRAFGRGVQVDTARGEISARSGRESLNFLALNLAYEVSLGLRTPGAAREFYDSTAALAVSGKSSPYMEGPLFMPRPRLSRGWEAPGGPWW